MIYDEPRYMYGGDQFLIMETGNDMSIRQNCMVIEINRLLTESKIKGVLNSQPTWRSLLVQYNPFEISFEDLKKELENIRSNVKQLDEIPSRIVEIPIIYGGKWGPDFEATAEYNKVSVEKAIELHSSELQWVGLVGFVPGHPFVRPLRKDQKLHGKIYDSPRTYTPLGTIGLGGITTTFYTVATPGGYAMIGYIPAVPYDPAQLLPDFQKSAILLRAGDRIKFKPIDVDELNYIRQQVIERQFRFNIKEGIFKLSEWEKEQRGE